MTSERAAQLGVVRRLPVLTLDVINVSRYYDLVIRSFADRETEKVFSREGSPRFPGDVQRRMQRKLEILDAAERLHDLSVPPGNQLEKLSGDRQGQWSIRVNDQWRVCFRWQGGDAFKVEIVDYH